MDADFWHHKWANNDIGFHESEANPLLLRHFPALGLAQDSRVFLPLCGKTLDIHWLLSQGYRVAGAELSRTAVEQLFDELGAAPRVSASGPLERHHAPGLDIFVGDLFDLSRQMLGPVDAIYDRAALVALPQGTRGRYATHLIEISGHAPQLLVCFDYDQRLMEGPPFSLSDEEIARHYAARYDVRLLERAAIAGGFKGKFPAKETVWLLGR